MATIGAEDLEYDSDPEEAKLSLAMRRREASDDEEGEGSGEKPRPDRRVPIHSDESDDQGGAAEYEEEEDEDEEELILEDEEEAEIEEEVDCGPGQVDGSVDVATEKEVGDGDGDGLPPEETDDAEGEEGKKENEPFAVPTAGAFYMHDDRFRDSSGARHRRGQGGKKLWESRDDKKWGHDKYEEISTTDRRFQEGRSLKGNFRGRGRGRGGGERGFGRGSRPKAYNNNTAENSNPIQGTRSMRGKGQRKYEPAMKNNVNQPSMQYKQSGKYNEKPSNASSGRAFTPMTNSEFESAPARTNAFASSLNSASPPFYPSGSSTNEINSTQKRDGHFGNANKNFRSSSGDGASQRGKNTANSIGMDKLNIKDSTSPAAGKPLNSINNSSSGATNATQSRVHGRNGIPPQMAYQPASYNQNTRGSLSAHPHAFQRGHLQGRGQAAVQPPAQQMGHRPGSGSQASPPHTALSINSFESGDMDLPSEANKSKTAIVAKGKGVVQGSGRGSVMYGGAQVIGTTGNMPGAHGDQNFPGAPTFLPVMQFGGQHPGGMGVPAVGMAFPGYVGQPQGRGNTEMTWLPVLAGAAGAYCPPYIPVDEAYHARPSGQSSSASVSSKENSTTKADSEWKSPQKSEIVNDEFGQRQNKPRRYSEMNFGQ